MVKTPPVIPDSVLLCQYLEHRDEAAFAELVRRHLPLVYAATLRLANGNRGLAEDATLAAFTQLARKARRLTGHATLAGWLHTTARFHALRSLRGEHRRRTREQEAYAMNESTDPAALDAVWAQLRPLLDKALSRLGDGDRNAVLLRFFEEKSYREVGATLGVSENAAQMRVERALEKLRAQFSRHGVTTTAALLISALGAHGAVSAPASLAITVTEKSLAGASAGGPSILAGKLSLLAFGALAALALAAFLFLQPSPSIVSASSRVPPSGAPQPVAKADPPTTSPPMNPSSVLNAGTLAAVLLAAAPVAVAQNDPAPASSAVPAAVAPTLETATPTGTYAGLVAANNQFAFDLLHQVNPRPNENVFFSPYSISTALAMTLAGAHGDTAAQLAKALRLSGVAAEALTPDYTALQEAVAKAQTLAGAQLSIANSLWAEQNPAHPFLQSFLDGTLTHFSASATMVDFIHHPAEAAQQINAWVEEKTKGKIKNLLRAEDVNPSTRLALVNTIYFKGQWVYPFSPSRNTNGEFHNAEGVAVPSVFMNAGLRLRYADITDGPVPCQLVCIPYGTDPREAWRITGTGVSFVAILPRAPGDIAALVQNLTAEKLDAWLQGATFSTVLMTLPKFKLEEHYKLAGVLQGLGVRNAFIDPDRQPVDPNAADFSGIDGARDLYISSVIHQTFVEVNEQGTEAAAATAVLFMGGAAGPRTPPPEFHADHPFLFLIRDDVSGSILFLGQLSNPDPLHEDIVPPTPPSRGFQARGARIGTAARGVNRGIQRGGTGTAADAASARPLAPPAASGTGQP